MTQSQHPGAPWPDALVHALIVTANLHVEPVAVFDFDNTCIQGDVGEALHAWLCATGGYDFDGGGFWHALDDCPQRERLQGAWAAHRASGAALVPDDLVVDLTAVYLRRLRRMGIADAYRWSATLHAGMTPDAVQDAAMALFAAHVAGEGPDHLARIDWSRRTPDDLTGLRPSRIQLRPAIGRLLRFLHGQGFQTWVCSATNTWAIEAVAPLLGFQTRHVLANRCHVESGRIVAKRQGPTTWREGKREVLERHHPGGIHVAIGDSIGDAEMLEMAPCAVLLDRGDETLRARAEAGAWHIVPAASLNTSE